MTVPNNLLPTTRQRVTLRQNILGLAVTCAVLVPMAILCVVGGMYREGLKGLLATGFLTLCAIATVCGLVLHVARPEQGSLVLSPQGFTVGRHTIAWNTVKTFRVESIGGAANTKQIVYDRVKDPEGAEGRTLVVSSFGGLKHQDLVELMNQWHQHHTSGRS